jgi:pimeloyl-ACP methyl ester carboxylesterase
VLALDQHGHSDSDPPPDGDYTIASLAGDLAAFADALGLQTFVLVGLSLGGRVAIQYAGTYPGRVSRLVVVDIGPDIAPDGRARVGRMMAGEPERFATADQAFVKLLREFLDA